MVVRVVYHSTTGNTEKIARTIAEAMNVQSEQIGEDTIVFTDEVDLLFLGDGIYWNKPHKKTKAFCMGLDPEKIKYAAVFGTYGNQTKIGDELGRLLQDKGVNVVGSPFVCKGKSVGTKNQDHPDENDLRMASEYAKGICTEISLLQKLT